MTTPEEIAGSAFDAVSAVVPVYKSAATLPRLVDELTRTLDACTRRFEIILVDDGSGDDSWTSVMRIAGENGHVRGIRLMRNFGQHNALLAGIRPARYATIVTLDDDLQNPPGEIPALLAKLDEGYDVVYGVPKKEQHSALRSLASRATKVALREALGGTGNVTDVSAFRAFRTSLREAFANYQSPTICLDVLLTWGTTSFSAVRVEHQERTNGTSTYTMRKLVVHAFNMITGFSTRPLQLASLVGFAFTLVGVAIVGILVVNYAVNRGSVPGFTFLAAIVTLFSGAQLFTLGVLGEYLSRMHFRLMERPTYVVQQTTWRRTAWNEAVPTLTEAATVDLTPD